MKGSTQCNNGPEINNDCTVNTNKPNTLHNIKVWNKNEENDKITKLPQKLRQQNRYKKDEYLDTNIQMCYDRIVKKPNILTYQ